MRNSAIVVAALAALLFSGPLFGQETDVVLPAGPWNETIKKDVDEALGLSADDPVSALLTFKSVLDREEDGPTPEQKIWLSAKIDGLQPKALKTLQDDYDQAVKVSDFRAALIVSTVADKIAEDSIKTQPTMMELKNKFFNSSPEATCVWTLSDVSARFITGSYTEGNSLFAGGQITLTPEEGFKILRVTASVRNVSLASDKSYALWALEDIKRALAPIYSNPEEHKKDPCLWLDDSYVYLLTSASDLILCSHVCRPCTLRRGAITVSSPNGTGRVIVIPQIVDSGKEATIDVIFSVPEGITDYRLWVIGSAPAALNFAAADETLKEDK